MGRSKSKSNSRSISKWRKFFTSGSKQVDPPVEEPQTTAISASPASNNSFSGAPKSRSNSISGVPRRRSTGTREDGTGPLKTMEEPPSIGTGASKSSTLEKKEEKKEIKEEVKKEEIKKESGSKCEEAPSKNAKKKEVKKEEQEASVFEEVQGPAAPAQTGTHGIKNKMRWKIDVEGADCNGDQKMPEVLERLTKLRKKMKTKKCKVLKVNDKTTIEEEDEKEPAKNEESIINSARVLQHVKFECLISKEISEQEQETLRAFCRSGDQEEKAENLIEKIVLAVLNAVVTKNDFVRQLAVPGELRMFAVDEKKAKLPMMALLMARKDLLYVSWSKANRDFEDTLDGTWAGMAVKKES